MFSAYLHWWDRHPWMVLVILAIAAVAIFFNQKAMIRMSMSTHVIGFALPDEQWKGMKAVWDACKNSGVPVPKEVDRFFSGNAPDENGVEVKLPLKKWSDSYREGFDIDLDSIPKHVRIIRFYNSF